jgi:dTDP-4-amino-4,6-dideoxygalactose transaminase
VSCATSVVRAGATPVFVDIDPVTLMIDPSDLARRIGPRSRAVLCVHYGGMPCDMDAIGRVAKGKALPVVEDAAQAFGSAVAGRPLGTLGDIGCFSYHGTKNVTCGEGGALVTGRSDLAERALLMREKGTNRRAFLEGRVEKYTWVETGGSFELSDLLAAVLLAQLPRVDAIQAARRRVAERYLDQLAPLAETGRLTLPNRSPGATPNWHVFHVLLPTSRERDRVMNGLAQNGIEATFHFVPLHSSPYGRERLGYRRDELPVTEDVASRLLRLPIYPDLSQSDQQHVIDTLHRLVS